MKTLLLVPPQWHPVNPHLAVPLLSGQLNANGFECVGCDLNVEFYDYVLNRSFIEKTVLKVKELYEEFSTFFADNEYDKNKIDEYPIEIKSKLIKYLTIKEYIENKADRFSTTCENIDDAVSVLRTERFYEPKKFCWAIETVTEALKIVMLPYAPAQMTLGNYKNPLFLFDFDSLMYQSYHKEENIFIDFFEEKLKELDVEKYDLIGISITAKQQFMQGLTLARMLRERTNAHITIGGFFSTAIREDIKNHHKVFELCDSLGIGEGERSIVELARYVNGEISIDDVSNIIYKNAEGKIVFNPYVPVTKLDDIAPSCYDGFDFSKYLTPDIALLYQTSKGCFWGKCSFCDFHLGRPNFHVKSAKKVVDELELLVNKYGVTKFVSADEHLFSGYAEKFADEIISRGLNIQYDSFARLEKGFTKELFNKLYRSGCRRLDYGYESASERIFTLMNKGVDFNCREKVMQDAASEKIWNHIFCIIGFPTETREEAMLTIETAFGRDYIDSASTTLFYLKKNSPIFRNPEKYGVCSMSNVQDMESLVSFEDGVMSDYEKREMNDLFLKKYLETAQDKAFPFIEAGSDYFFLYICRYGRDVLKKMKWRDL
ncbi:MAG: radical SAM protein [Clostridia bacterium]|nr:radical SAM protein [Clostridia bacterium]